MGAGKSLQLLNNGSNALTVAANGSFNFLTPLAHGTNYAVTIATQPANQTCNIASASGTALNAVANIQISCVNNVTVGGNLVGLVSSELLAVTLLNKGANSMTLSSSGTFTFSQSITAGSTYAVTVGAQPAGKTCMVSNASGTANSNITTVFVECILKAVGVLSDTGITASQCYGLDNNVLISCIGTNATGLSSTQDGMVGFDVTSPSNADGKLGLSYSAVAGQLLTNCVKDNRSGLVWESKTSDGGVRDKNKVYTNYLDSTQSATFGSATDATGYVAAVNALALCGFTDWRLPNRSELQELVDYSKAPPVALIDSAWFPNIRANLLDDRYWTNATSALSSSNGWQVGFSIGDVIEAERLHDGAIRLVRGSRPVITGSRFVLSSDSLEVHDRLTGLSWRRCTEAYSATQSNSSCATGSYPFTHQEAMQRATVVAANTGKTWRLPNAKELLSIVNASNVTPPFDSSYFPSNANEPIYGYDFWTSTPYINNSFGSMVVRRDDGKLSPSARSVTNYKTSVRLVRDTK